MSKKAGSTRKGGRKYLLLLPFIAVLLVIGIAADILYPTYSQVINGALTDRTRAPEDYVQEALANSKAVNIALEEEGAVLLKNDGALPLNAAATRQINVYGILSAHHYVGGTGSGSTGAQGVDLKTALESVGFTPCGACWNPAPWPTPPTPPWVPGSRVSMSWSCPSTRRCSPLPTRRPTPTSPS